MKTWITSLKFIALMTLLTGFVYPALVTVLGQVAFTDRVNGSLKKNRAGTTVGSSLLAQDFKSSRYFWPRPSAVNFNPLPSGGSNLGPLSAELAQKMKERASGGAVKDLLSASGSGLDPHISPEAALSQVARVAQARRVPEEKVRSTVLAITEARQFGLLGETRVNVLELNLQLDEVLGL